MSIQNSAARPKPLGVPFVLALLLSAIYPWLSALDLPLEIKVLVKGLVCPLLALAIWRQRGGDRVALWLVAALLCSMAGDIFLAVDRVRLFVAGLGSFLLAHLCYLILFWMRRGPVSRRQKLQLLLLGFFGVGMLVLLTPGLGALKLPVYAYMAAILAMGATALCLPGRPLVGAGALMFILSDSLIALDKFVTPVFMAGPAIWYTYAAAQVLIVLGWRRPADPG